jgi:hypothetical protein
MFFMKNKREMIKKAPGVSDHSRKTAKMMLE